MTLYEFYGDECPHCKNMDSKVEQLEEDEDVKVEKLEVWNNQENAEKMEELDDGKCGGVPFSTTQKAKNGSVGKQILKL